MQWKICLLGKHAICFDHESNISGFHGKNHIIHTEFCCDFRMAHCTFKKRFGSWITMLFENVFFERTGIHTHSDGSASLFRFCENFFDAISRANISGIDAHFRNACFNRFECKNVIEMNISDNWNRCAFDNISNRFSSFFVIHRHANDIHACFLTTLYLLNGCIDIRSLGFCHGLHADRGIATDRYGSNHYLTTDSSAERSHHIRRFCLIIENWEIHAF